MALQVRVVDGSSLNCAGRCEQLRRVVGPLSIISDLYVHPIYGSNAILGVQWLKMLGKIIWDFFKLIMTFQYQGLPYVLQGIQEAPVTTMDRTHMQ